MKTLLAALGCTALLAGCAAVPGDYYSYNYNYGTPYAYGYDYGPAYYGPGYYGYYDYAPAIGFSYYGGHYHDGHYHDGHYNRDQAFDGNRWHAAAPAHFAGASRARVTAAPQARIAHAPNHVARGSGAAARPQRAAPSVAHARPAPEHDHS